MFDDIAQEAPSEIRLGIGSIGAWLAGLLLSLFIYVTHEFSRGESGLIELWAFSFVIAAICAAGSFIGLGLSLLAFTRPHQNRALGFVGLALNLVTLITLALMFLGSAH